MLERVWRKGNPLTLLMGMQTSTATMENSVAAKSRQLCPTLCDPMDGSPPGSAVPGILQAYDPAIPLLGRHTEETRIERDICTPMFIVTLFIIARTWKQPRCPSADEWIRKLWYIFTMEYSVQFSRSVMSDSLRPHESQHARPPCPLPTPGVHSDSRPSSQ